MVSHPNIESPLVDLLKAEVLQTRGGGRSVQFTDIEKLKIERQRSTSPMDRKRPAEEELDSGDWTDVETRVSHQTNDPRK